MQLKIDRDRREEDLLIVRVPIGNVQQFEGLLDDEGIFFKDPADEDDPDLGFVIIYEVDVEKGVAERVLSEFELTQ
jgi:hypothetical protein